MPFNPAVLRITRVALDRHRELALAAVFLALAGWEIFEFAVLERRDTPPPLTLAVLTPGFQVLAILAASSSSAGRSTSTPRRT